MTITCEFCGKPLSTTTSSSSQRVMGWVSPRNKGGANHIRFKKRQKEWAHNVCLEEAYHPATAAQQQLF